MRPALDGADQSLAASNEALARGYDAVPYAPKSLDIVSIARVRTVAALFGCAERVADVLDLGCGRGAQLALAASETEGRLFGVDLSKSACEAARERLAPFADRAEVIRGDLLALTPDRLGRFDLIYCLGVISFVPPAVRAKMITLIGACLKPGGVAVLSYYSGAMPLMRASLGRVLTAATSGEAQLEARVRQARSLLAQLKSSLEQNAAAHPLQLAAVANASVLDDVMFFHEMLNGESTSLEASDLEQRFSAEGMGFIGHHQRLPFMGLPTSKDRAYAADVAAFTAGGYRYAIFGKGEAARGGADPRRPGLLWSTALRRRSPDAGLPPGPVVYEEAESGLSATIDLPVIQALVEAIAVQPLTWSEAHASARQRVLGATGKPAMASEAQIAKDLVTLWASGAVHATLA